MPVKAGINKDKYDYLSFTYRVKSSEYNELLVFHIVGIYLTSVFIGNTVVFY
ncbi:hypothetical protein [Metabacillus fastidiosus]|uniref:hypothetical protein n=1 Tax=Metabacillus fastidiosus TaxID=1458 RepID=UPI003D2BDCEE